MASTTQLTHNLTRTFSPQVGNFEHDLYTMEQQNLYVFKSKLVGMDYFLVYHKMALDNILCPVLGSSYFHLKLQMKLILKTVLWRGAQALPSFRHKFKLLDCKACYFISLVNTFTLIQVPSCFILMQLTLRVLLVCICTKSRMLQVDALGCEDIIGNIYCTSKVAWTVNDYHWNSRRSAC